MLELKLGIKLTKFLNYNKMTIEELNKIIQEELKAYLNEEQTDEAIHGEDGDDDIDDDL